MRAGALVLWLWEVTHVPKVVISNPGTFFHIRICSKIRNVLEKTKINEKEAVVGPFKTKLSDQLAVVVTYLCQLG